MSRLLQLFDRRSSSYERPGMKWVCGHSEDGEPCRRGPNSKGQCRTKTECRPHKVDDRWVCTRPESAGGPCGDGPNPDGTCARPVPPCVPIRSQRARRTRLALLVYAFAFGAVLLMLGGALRWSLSPGPVIRAHGEVESCAGCHTAFERGPAGWVSEAVAGTDTKQESGRCVACHEMGRAALFAHSMSPRAMDARTELVSERAAKSSPGFALDRVLPTERQPLEMIPCSRCHREHRGRDADLTEMVDERCQACHQLVFPSFTDGHPEFESYPSDRRPHVLFDHAKHFNRHFAKAGQAPPTNCGSCHLPDAFGRDMVARTFDETCAGCHRGQIDGTDRTAGSKAIAVFRVPGVDATTLEEKGLGVGEWPIFAEDDPTHFMRLLLAGDPEIRQTLRVFDAIDDPLDLREADQAELEAASRVAWAVKELIYDVMVVGVDSIEDRLEATTGRPMDHALLIDLVGALPREALVSAQRDWFPNLLTEVPLYRSGSFPDSAASLDETGEIAQTGDESGEDPASNDDNLLAGDGDDLLASDELVADDGDDLLVDDDLLADDDLLGNDDLLADDDLLGGGDLLAEDEIWGADDEVFDLGGEEEAVEVLVELPKVNPEEWASLGGWYLDDLALYYRPVEHADPFMGAWLEVLSRTFGTRHESAARPLFASLIDPLAPGACAKCHPVGKTLSGSVEMSWSPARQPRPEKDFTVFSHVSHFSLPGGAECVSCHQMAGAETADTGIEGEAGPFAGSSFRDIGKELCSGCHVEDGAGEGCTTCHGYHVGVTRHRVLGSEIS